MRILLTALASVVLLAFSAHASWDSEYQKVVACSSAVDSDPRLSPINKKLAVEAPTFEQLSDQSIPTETESSLLRERLQRKQPCRDLERAAIQTFHPWMLPAADLRYFQAELVYVQLIQRRLVYGNANALLRQSFLEFSERWSAYQKARSDEERRQLARGFEDLSRQFQSAPPPAPGASRVTCQWVGPTLHCTAF